jgi:hypothetical protein
VIPTAENKKNYSRRMQNENDSQGTPPLMPSNQARSSWKQNPNCHNFRLCLHLESSLKYGFMFDASPDRFQTMESYLTLRVFPTISRAHVCAKRAFLRRTAKDEGPVRDKTRQRKRHEGKMCNSTCSHQGVKNKYKKLQGVCLIERRPIV